LNAYEDCVRWLQAAPRSRWQMPHLDFAIAIEEELMCRYDPLQNKVERYEDSSGTWVLGGSVRGEVVAEALERTFACRGWVLEDGKLWLRTLPDINPLFRTAPMLTSVGEMSTQLRFDPATVPLDDES
jgi:hypothetical protein